MFWQSGAVEPSVKSLDKSMTRSEFINFAHQIIPLALSGAIHIAVFGVWILQPIDSVTLDIPPVASQEQVIEVSFFDAIPTATPAPVEIEASSEPQPEPEPKPETESVETSEILTTDAPVRKPEYKKPEPQQPKKQSSNKDLIEPKQKAEQHRKVVNSPSQNKTAVNSNTLDVPKEAAEPSRQTSSTTVSTKPIAAGYLNNPAPPYPEKARLRKQEGTVLLNVRVSSLGHPVSVTVASSSGYSLLDETAVKTVRRWSFVPARNSGKPIEANVEIPIIFTVK
jgi:periplasmic protein TonB